LANLRQVGIRIPKLTPVANGTYMLLNREWQSHSGAVDSNTPSVHYGYGNGSSNHARRISMTYPDGVVLEYRYGTTGSADDAFNRVQHLQSGTSMGVEYSFLGVDRTVICGYACEPSIQLTYVKQAGESDGGAGDTTSHAHHQRLSRNVSPPPLTSLVPLSESPPCCRFFLHSSHTFTPFSRPYFDRLQNTVYVPLVRVRVLFLREDATVCALLAYRYETENDQMAGIAAFGSIIAFAI
jgi:hypothetical protein